MTLSQLLCQVSTKPLVGAAVAAVAVAQQLAPPLRAAARGAHRLLACPVSCGRGSVAVVVLLPLFHRHGAASSLSASARAKFLFLVVIVVVTIIWLLLCLLPLSPFRADVFAGI